MADALHKVGGFGATSITRTLTTSLAQRSENGIHHHHHHASSRTFAGGHQALHEELHNWREFKHKSNHHKEHKDILASLHALRHALQENHDSCVHQLHVHTKSVRALESKIAQEQEQQEVRVAPLHSPMEASEVQAARPPSRPINVEEIDTSDAAIACDEKANRTSPESELKSYGIVPIQSSTSGLVPKDLGGLESTKRHIPSVAFGPFDSTEAEEMPGIAAIPGSEAVPKTSISMVSVRKSRGMEEGRKKLKADVERIQRVTLTHNNSIKTSIMHFRTTERGGVGAVLRGPVFADPQTLKEHVRAALEQKDYNPRTRYKKNSIFSRIAVSSILETCTLFAIFFNTIWIALEVDNNDEPMLINSHIGFQLVEYLLFVFFTFDAAVRWMAYLTFVDVLRDRWLLFDTMCLAAMVFELVVLQLIVFPAAATMEGGGAFMEGLGSSSLLKVFRLIRLTRIAKMAHVFQALPELMILLKGIFVAARSVLLTLGLLTFCIYLFALIFRQFTYNTPMGKQHFPSVLAAMATLLLGGVMPDQRPFLTAMATDSALVIVSGLFILLATFTVMNMLVGVLVEVVKVVSTIEKEELLVANVKDALFKMLNELHIDIDNNNHISKQEFQALIVQPKAVDLIRALGVDIMGLVDFSDFIFAEDRELSYAEFMSMVLELRGSNSATVRDIVELRKWLMQELDMIKDCAIDLALGAM